MSSVNALNASSILDSVKNILLKNNVQVQGTDNVNKYLNEDVVNRFIAKYSNDNDTFTPTIVAEKVANSIMLDNFLNSDVNSSTTNSEYKIINNFNIGNSLAPYSQNSNDLLTLYDDNNNGVIDGDEREKINFFKGGLSLDADKSSITDKELRAAIMYADFKNENYNDVINNGGSEEDATAASFDGTLSLNAFSSISDNIDVVQSLYDYAEEQEVNKANATDKIDSNLPFSEQIAQAQAKLKDLGAQETALVETVEGNINEVKKLNNEIKALADDLEKACDKQEKLENEKIDLENKQASTNKKIKNEKEQIDIDYENAKDEAIKEAKRNYNEEKDGDWNTYLANALSGIKKEDTAQLLSLKAESEQVETDLKPNADNISRNATEMNSISDDITSKQSATDKLADTIEQDMQDLDDIQVEKQETKALITELEEKKAAEEAEENEETEKAEETREANQLNENDVLNNINNLFKNEYANNDAIYALQQADKDQNGSISSQELNTYLDEHPEVTLNDINNVINDFTEKAVVTNANDLINNYTGEAVDQLKAAAENGKTITSNDIQTYMNTNGVTLDDINTTINNLRNSLVALQQDKAVIDVNTAVDNTVDNIFVNAVDNTEVNDVQDIGNQYQVTENAPIQTGTINTLDDYWKNVVKGYSETVKEIINNNDAYIGNEWGQAEFYNFYNLLDNSNLTPEQKELAIQEARIDELAVFALKHGSVISKPYYEDYCEKRGIDPEANKNKVIEEMKNNN